LAASVANLLRSVSTANVPHMTLENMERQGPRFLPHRGSCLDCRIHPGPTEGMPLCPTPLNPSPNLKVVPASHGSTKINVDTGCFEATCFG